MTPLVWGHQLTCLSHGLGPPRPRGSSCCHPFTFSQYERRNIHLFLWGWRLSQYPLAEEIETTALMISDSNYSNSSNNSKNTAAANSQVNSCECFVMLANYQGDFYEKPYQECCGASEGAACLCLDLKKKWKAGAVESMHGGNVSTVRGS